MKKIISTSLLAVAIASPLVQAQQPEIAISAGAFELFESQYGAELGIEYRFLPKSRINLVPTIGLAANSDGGYWLHGGIRYDISLSPKWLLTPQLAAVAYEKGAGKDLGSGFLFRTGLELGYRIAPHSKLGLTLYHMSNASLAKNNPGSESLILSYSFTPRSSP